ncbi:MAG: hypothetical protein ACRDCW_12400 [Sarcina sp.]
MKRMIISIDVNKPISRKRKGHKRFLMKRFNTTGVCISKTLYG